MRGVLTFHSETGTEGGHWAFQDELFMEIPDDTQECEVCGFAREYVERIAAEGQSPMDSTVGSRLCRCGEHRWVLRNPDGCWSHEGLHILKDGDQLTIFDPDDEHIVWSGTIRLNQHPPFTQHVGGLWIHADQVGEDREVWAARFLNEYPAILTLVEP